MLETKKAETEHPGSGAVRRHTWHTLGRFLIVSLFILVLGFFVALHSILPALLRSGALDAAVRNAISSALKAKVSFASVDMDRPGIVSIHHLKVEKIHPTVSLVHCPRVDAEFSSALIPFAMLRRLTFTDPQVRVDVEVEQISNLLSGTGQGSPLEIKGPTGLPSVVVRNATVRGALAKDPFEIRAIEGQLLNKGGYHLPFRITGSPRGMEQDTLNAAGHVQLTDTSGQLVITEFRSSIHDMNLDIRSDPATPIKGTLRIGTLKIAKSIRRVLKQLIDFEINALVSTDSSFEITREGMEKLKLQGKIASYTFVGQTMDIRGKDQPLSLEVELTRKVGENGWSCGGTLSNVQTQLQQNILFKIDQIAFQFRMSGVGAEIHPVGEIRFNRCTFSERLNDANLSMQAKLGFDLSVDPEAETARGRLDLLLNQFEIILKDEVYDQFSKTSVEVAYDGTVDLKRKQIDFTELSLSIPEIGKAYLKGEVHMGKNGLGYDVRLIAPSIPAKFLASQANLAPLTNVGGTVDVDVHCVNGEGRFRARGSLHGREIAADYGPIGIRKSSFHLPFHIYLGSAAYGDDKVETGTVSLGELAYPGGAVRNLDLLVASRENGFTLKEPIVVPVFDGTVHVTGFECSDILGQPQIKSAASFSKLNLEKMSVLLGLSKPVQGELNGFFVDIAPEGDDLVFHGSAQAQAFGGNLILHDIRIRNFATGHHSAQLSLDVHEISLEEVCKVFVDFGVLRGVLEGTVEGLEIYKTGEVVEFEICVYTVPRPGVNQKIDVRGIKKMVQLAEGPDSELLSELKWAPDALYYSKLGVYAKLKGNRLLLRGKYYETSALTGGLKEHPLETLKRNGGIRKSRTEYMVYGSADPLFGLISFKTFNVIKGRPGKWTNFDRFKEMLEQVLKGDGT